MFSTYLGSLCSQHTLDFSCRVDFSTSFAWIFSSSFEKNCEWTIEQKYSQHFGNYFSLEEKRNKLFFQTNLLPFCSAFVQPWGKSYSRYSWTGSAGSDAITPKLSAVRDNFDAIWSSNEEKETNKKTKQKQCMVIRSSGKSIIFLFNLLGFDWNWIFLDWPEELEIELFETTLFSHIFFFPMKIKEEVSQ